MKNCVLVAASVVFLTVPIYAQRSAIDDSSFSRKELVELKKEALYSELSMLSNSVASHNSLKWQLRILLATFAGAYLVLSASKDNKLTKYINPGILGIGLLLVVGVFCFYDCHLSSLTTSLNDRSRSVKTFLGDIVNKEIAELTAFKTHVDVREKFRTNNPTLCKSICATMSEFFKRKKEYFAYYTLFLGIFFVGWHVHKKVYDDATPRRSKPTKTSKPNKTH